MTEIKEHKEIVISQHSWRRYFARMIDTAVVSDGLIIFLFVITHNIRFSFLENIFRVLLEMFILFIVEALLITKFGTTLGKWVLHIQLKSCTEDAINYKRAFRRSFGVYISGVAIGLPIISLLAELNAYDELLDKGSTSWDDKVETKVVFQEINFARGVIATLLILSPLIVGIVFYFV